MRAQWSRTSLLVQLPQIDLNNRPSLPIPTLAVQEHSACPIWSLKWHH